MAMRKTLKTRISSFNSFGAAASTRKGADAEFLKEIVPATHPLCMHVRLLLAAAVCSLGFGCSTSDGNGTEPPGGTAGQTSGTGGTSVIPAGGGGAAAVAGTSSTGMGGVVSNGGVTNGGVTGTGGVVGMAGSSMSGGAGSGGGTGGTSAGGAAGAAGSAGSGTGGTVAAGCAGVTNAKFCEDWDKLGMGKPTGDYSVSDGVVVDTSKAFSGTQSLHFQKLTKPAGGTPNIRFTKQFPLASNDMHGRVMVFMAQTPKTSSHWNFITSSNSGGTEWSIGGQYGNFELVCDPPDNGLDSKTAFPGGKWVCMQWEFKYPGNDNTTFVTKIDGVSVDQGEFTGANSKGEKWKAGTWNNLKIGWEIFGSSDTDVEFWIDDLAFGEQVIACPAK
jgi:hypothetical protein